MMISFMLIFYLVSGTNILFINAQTVCKSFCRREFGLVEPPIYFQYFKNFQLRSIDDDIPLGKLDREYYTVLIDLLFKGVPDKDLSFYFKSACIYEKIYEDNNWKDVSGFNYNIDEMKLMYINDKCWGTLYRKAIDSCNEEILLNNSDIEQKQNNCSIKTRSFEMCIKNFLNKYCPPCASKDICIDEKE